MWSRWTLALVILAASRAAAASDLPKPAEGWRIELVARAPEIAYPTAIVVAPDGTVYLGQDPMDMPGPATVPSDSVVTLKDGRHLLVYNHTPKGRSPLNLALSKDGKAWEAALVLESEPGEYSYPAIIQTADERVHITYTWKRQKVRHLVVQPFILETKPIINGGWP